MKNIDLMCPGEIEVEIYQISDSLYSGFFSQLKLLCANNNIGLCYNINQMSPYENIWRPDSSFKSKSIDPLIIFPLDEKQCIEHLKGDFKQLLLEKLSNMPHKNWSEYLGLRNDSYFIENEIYCWILVTPIGIGEFYLDSASDIEEKRKKALSFLKKFKTDPMSIDEEDFESIQLD